MLKAGHARCGASLDVSLLEIVVPSPLTVAINFFLRSSIELGQLPFTVSHSCITKDILTCNPEQRPKPVCVRVRINSNCEMPSLRFGINCIYLPNKKRLAALLASPIGKRPNRPRDCIRLQQPPFAQLRQDDPAKQSKFLHAVAMSCRLRKSPLMASAQCLEVGE